ncbi:hypothetical protein C8R43DRAFT_1121167 [Mycena crocata]|nr:hypothetical protein C8R43DRAFT_1121167 [Mycena crocata]
MADNTSAPPTNANVNAAPGKGVDNLHTLISDLSHLSLDMARMCVEVQSVLPGVALSKQSLKMASLCLDLQDELRRSFNAAVQTAIAAAAPPPPLFHWVKGGEPLTPDQLDASYPQGVCDDSPWHVVIVGREPGMFISSDEAGINVSGVPSGFRKKKDSHLEALAFYRARYKDGKVEKWRTVPVAPAPAAVADAGHTNLDPAAEDESGVADFDPNTGDLPVVVISDDEQ